MFEHAQGYDCVLAIYSTRPAKIWRHLHIYRWIFKKTLSLSLQLLFQADFWTEALFSHFIDLINFEKFVNDNISV